MKYYLCICVIKGDVSQKAIATHTIGETTDGLYATSLAKHIALWIKKLGKVVHCE